jgi:hypothetical protein
MPGQAWSKRLATDTEIMSTTACIWDEYLWLPGQRDHNIYWPVRVILQCVMWHSTVWYYADNVIRNRLDVFRRTVFPVMISSASPKIAIKWSALLFRIGWFRVRKWRQIIPSKVSRLVLVPQDKLWDNISYYLKTAFCCIFWCSFCTNDCSCRRYTI